MPVPAVYTSSSETGHGSLRWGVRESAVGRRRGGVPKIARWLRLFRIMLPGDTQVVL
ncbi:hypothetical protein BDQ17DRAFT_1376298 [Cyathus striatus]|nr:hypothetical protein BDQ17DRAFT_1376298 [Cyathus striatus]